MRDDPVTWSTRELADLAGTTVNAVRHYHSIGLLDPPERCENGYKQYQVRHLVRLSQVRRLAELGVPLAQVQSDEQHGLVVPGGLNELDAQVEAQIERLDRARADIAALLRDSAPADTPRGFEAFALRLSEADRSLLHVLTRLHGTESVNGLKRMVAAEPRDLREQFDALEADSAERSRERLARSLAASGANWRSADRPWSARPAARALRRDHAAQRAVRVVLAELYNPAQLDVLGRLDAGAVHGRPEPLSA
ncbi:MerR family transcriptional regulator [Herbiconiux sp. CPCC 203407]|uniref:MerR family transcriptional regulator n=1 Tax=Herbiconiux oxytropis TaxID=2970915 RepID=A0AA41XGM2_9MICO|nr:MerR family transcriptional regulator [Herbiconiux oxytropis]MCS5721479.1 MerR family transcriptional regulator [Herbiconiux oxytropis]MCS5724556.1 MerR family transcriptional regulator [Herbiconiux oxytropis]